MFRRVASLNSAIPALQQPSDPFFANVSLLINAENGLVDESNNSFTLTAVGNTTVATDQVKYGTQSVYFDRVGDRIEVPASSAFDFGPIDGTGTPLTIEMWIRLFNKNGNYLLFEMNKFELLYSASLGLQAVSTATGIDSDQPFNISEGSSTNWSIDTWYHISFQRDAAGTLFLHKDGTFVALGSSTTHLGNSVTTNLIGGNTFNQDLGGWIDDLRITKGVARYGFGNYTPPNELPTS